MILAAGVTCAKIRRFDYSKSTAAVRDQIDRIRNHYLRAGGWLGWSWWLLWIPCCVAVRFEAIVYPAALSISAAISVIGLAASLIVYRRILNSSGPTAQKWRRALAGESLSNAYVALDEIAATE